MNFPIVWFSVLVILSNELLGNEIEQPAQSMRYTVFNERETCSKAVESLQTKLKSQTIALSKMEADAKILENSLNNLQTKVDVQGTLISNLEALLGKMEAKIKIQETAMKELVTKKAWQEPIAQSPANRTIITPEGDEVEILCIVHGIPLPEIKWTRENASLESDRVVVENYGRVLRIKNARLNDEGTYVCVAANGIGTPATQSVRLQVYDPSQECHRRFESDRGNLAIKTMSSGCLWLIKLQNTTGFRVELDPLTEPIWFISEPTSSNSNYQFIKLSVSEHTSHVFEGKSLAIVVPPGRVRTTLSWTGLELDDSGVSSSTKFVDNLEGSLEWESQHDGTYKLFWAIDLELNGELNWTLNTISSDLRRDLKGRCPSNSVSDLLISFNGNINEIHRTCGETWAGKGSLKLQISYKVIVLPHSRSKLRVSWTHHEGPLERNVDGVVAGTDDDGAFVIPFNASIRKVVDSGLTFGVTYDWNSGKIYYLKYKVGIKRSNLDGTDSEILLSDRSSEFSGVTIEPASGNLYYGDQASCTIRVCDNDAKKCSTIANSDDLSAVQDVAVHLSKGLLFWSIEYDKVVRANLDGSNATVLLEGAVYGLDVDELEDRLYWGSSSKGIASCDLNGQDIRELPMTGENILDVAIDNEKVYFGNSEKHDVRVTSKLGTNSTLVKQLGSYVNNIALFGTRVSNRPANPCAEAKCAHLCVLVTRWTYRCTCPDDQVLNVDGKTCNM